MSILSHQKACPEAAPHVNAQVNAGLADPTMKARFAELGGSALPGAPVEFGRLIAEETEKWAKVMKFSGVGLD
jgi:hypothetical protein